MSIRREFLGCRQSAIRSSVDYLFDRYGQQGLVDLTEVTIVWPTGRAGRRFREVLLELAAEQERAIFPPRIMTVGSLPEQLYENKLPFATPLVQQFAWAEALRKTDPKTRERIVSPSLVAEPGLRWMELGALLQRQHLELTDHRLSFAAVAKLGRQLEGFTDFARWTALAKVQATYLRMLDDLKLWDRQTARNFAIDQHECAFDGDLILIGTVDLSRTYRAMLSQISPQVTALVFADRSWADRFDEFGCVVPEAWQNAVIDVQQHQILLADGPANQADAVVVAIEQLDGKYAADEITIGVPDVSLVPHLENKLGQFGLNVRWGPGRPLGASPPAQWLRIVADYLASNHYEPFAELVRHPDTFHYLNGLGYSKDIVKELDRYFETHLPDYVRPGKENAGQLPRGVELLLDLLRPLRGKKRSPNLWAQAIRDVLRRLYDKRQLNIDHDVDRATIAACDQINQTIERFDDLPEALMPDVSATNTILMLLAQMDDNEIPPGASENVIEMVGWLDLPLDDGKVAIVTSMNDGVVPRSVSSDVFLPNAMRQAIGLDDNAQRYARDAYALQVLLNSRMVVRLVTGRRAASNDPLRPSRLLLATKPEQLADRCLRLFSGAVDCPPIVLPAKRENLEFNVPRPAPLRQPIDTLSVSDFSRYLACPYRFYLGKVHGLRARDDRLTEIDAPTFGSLAHAVLELFGESEYAESSSAEEIELYLIEHLLELTERRFGSQPKPAVQVQVAQLKLRLAAFARRQAEWRQYGWKIIRTEFEEDHGELVVDGKTMRLKGRIDRIDHRRKDGEDEYAVLDYKTGDVGQSPGKKHLKGHKPGDPILPVHWIDLQLPLYLHLLKSVPEMQGKKTRLGYITLPSVSADSAFMMADWTEDDLATANQAAFEIVRQIRREQFWPPTDPYPYSQNDEYAAIVQSGIFGRAAFVEEAVGA